MFAPVNHPDCTPGEEHCHCQCHRVPGVYHCVPCCYPLPENLLEVSPNEFPIQAPNMPVPSVVHPSTETQAEISPLG